MNRLDPLAPAGRARPRPQHPPAHRREVSVVNNSTRFVDAVHADRAARFQAEAHQARIDRRSGTEERRIRRAIGRSIVRVGARIAADPAPERFLPARSR
jgi:hypothetical protein